MRTIQCREWLRWDRGLLFLSLFHETPSPWGPHHWGFPPRAPDPCQSYCEDVFYCQSPRPGKYWGGRLSVLSWFEIFPQQQQQTVSQLIIPFSLSSHFWLIEYWCIASLAEADLTSASLQQWLHNFDNFLFSNCSVVVCYLLFSCICVWFYSLGPVQLLCHIRTSLCWVIHWSLIS